LKPGAKQSLKSSAGLLGGGVEREKKGKHKESEDVPGLELNRNHRNKSQKPQTPPGTYQKFLENGDKDAHADQTFPRGSQQEGHRESVGFQVLTPRPLPVKSWQHFRGKKRVGGGKGTLELGTTLK